MKVAAQKLVLTKYFVITLEYFYKLKIPAIFNRKQRYLGSKKFFVKISNKLISVS